MNAVENEASSPKSITPPPPPKEPAPSKLKHPRITFPTERQKVEDEEPQQRLRSKVVVVQKTNIEAREPVKRRSGEKEKYRNDEDDKERRYKKLKKLEEIIELEAERKKEKIRDEFRRKEKWIKYKKEKDRCRELEQQMLQRAKEREKELMEAKKLLDEEE